MIRYRSKMRVRFAGCAWLLVLGCSGRLEVGDTLATEGSSGSGSSGSGGRVSAGSAVETLSVSETASVLGTSASCPQQVVTSLQSCSEERSVCGYWRTTDQGQEYTECGCYEASAGALQWLCYQGVIGGQGCPLTQPKAGASCFGNFGNSCHYPVRTTCFCDSELGTWSCEALPVPDYLEPPTTLNLATPVVDLTEAGRQALCTWFVDARMGPGFPTDPVEAGPDGFTTTSAACSACWDFPNNGRVPALHHAACVSNLSLSTCTAPASELVDCVATIYGGCAPREHGCARYTEKPGCAGTLVTTKQDSPKSASFCSVRIQ